MNELYAAMHTQLGATASERIQVVGRLGYGPTVPPSPLWPVQTRLLNA